MGSEVTEFDPSRYITRLMAPVVTDAISEARALAERGYRHRGLALITWFDICKYNVQTNIAASDWSDQTDERMDFEIPDIDGNPKPTDHLGEIATDFSDVAIDDATVLTGPLSQYLAQT